MKNLIILVLLFLISGFAEGSGKSISGISVCDSLVGELNVIRESGSKELPGSWDAFESIRFMKNGLLKHQLSRAIVINSFALVPGSPVIGTYSDIPRQYRGHRLFLISREEVFTENSGSGRCAILIKPEDLDSKPLMIYSDFIPEQIAKLILSKMPSFDPAHQPLAFTDLTPFELEEKKFRDNIRPLDDKLPTEKKRNAAETYQQDDITQPLSRPSNPDKSTKEGSSLYGPLIVGLLFLLFLTFFFMLKFKKPAP